MMRLSCSCSRNTWTSARILPFSASMNCVSSFCTISASEKCPSQSSRMIRPVPSTRIVPSGKSTTGASVFPSPRHPAANFGTLTSTSSATVPLAVFPLDTFRVSVNSKRAWRRAARVYIREIERVELRPKNVTLVAQRLDDALLFGACGGVVEHVLEREGSVFRRLRQPRLKVVEPGNKPGIVLTQFLHAHRDQVAREEFGQRGSDAFQKRPRPHQVKILISNKARGGQNLIRARNPLAIESGSFRQLDPAQDSAIALVISVLAVVIHNTLPPDAAECRIGRARKNDRVLYWNDGLVVIPIQRPGLQLSAVESAFVHEQVEGMLVMIALFADLAQSRAQFLKRHRLGSVGHVLLGYGSSCQLSSATSQPD